MSRRRAGWLFMYTSLASCSRAYRYPGLCVSAAATCQLRVSRETKYNICEQLDDFASAWQPLVKCFSVVRTTKPTLSRRRRR